MVRTSERSRAAQHRARGRTAGGEGNGARLPYSSGIQGSRLSHMRELRIQHEGRPYRVLYAFDPARTAFLLVGGDKTGNPRWYETSIPRAEPSTLNILENLNAGSDPSRPRTD